MHPSSHGGSRLLRGGGRRSRSTESRWTGRTGALCSALILVSLAGWAYAARRQASAVELSLTAGARVSDRVTVTARVTGFETSGVRQVVFLVDGQQVAEDSSVPYTFEWDTLMYPEGQHSIEAVATSMDGATARASVNVMVDNELGLGAEHHGRIALEALQRGDYEAARRHARRAARIDPKNVSGARALAALHEVAREYAQGIAVLEQSAISETDIEARRQLIGLYLLRADTEDTADAFLGGLAAAYEQYQRLVQALRAGSAQGTPVQKGDAAFAARKWRDAMIAYQAAGEVSEMPLPVANRLLLAYARAARWRDCELLLRTLERDNRVDDVTRAIQGYWLLQNHKPAEARRVVQQAVDNRVLPALVVAACADLILGDAKRAREEIDAAVAIAPGEPAVRYLQTFVTTEPLENRKLIVRGIAADPSNPEMLLRKVHDVLTSKRERKFDEAAAILDFARKIDPDCPDTLLVQAALLMVQRRPEEAKPLLEKVLAQDKDAPDALVGLALNGSLLDQTRQITDLLNHAMKVDEDRWNDVFVPKPLDYLNRVFKYRVTPILTPRVLYPAS